METAQASWIPVGIALAGMVAVTIGASLLGSSPAGSADAVRRRLALAGAIVAGLLLALVVIPVPAIVSLVDEIDGLADKASTGWSAAFQFLPQKVAGSVLPGLGIAVAAAGVGVRYFRRREDRPADQRAETGWAAVAIGILMTGAGWGEAVWLSTLTPLPHLVVEGQPLLHVGHEAEFEVRVEGTGDPSGWKVSAIVVRGDSEGPMERTFSARRFLARVDRKQTFEVGRDEVDPLFPLAVGNHWTYVGSAEWHDHVLWLVEAGRKIEDPVFMIAVVSESTEGPLHTYGVERREAGAEPIAYRAYNWNGDAMLEGAGDLVTRIDPSGQDPGTALPPAGDFGAESVSCHFALFPGCICRCLAAPAGSAGIPGPVQCHKQESEGVGFVKFLASAFVGLATAGLVIPDFGADRKWELVESGSGPLPALPLPPPAPVDVAGDAGGDEDDPEQRVH